MQKSLGEIAKLIDGEVEGDETTLITGVAGIKEAGPGDITFVANPKYLPLLETTRAGAVIVDRGTAACEKNLLRTEHPYIAFTTVLKLFAVKFPVPKGIHPTAIVSQNVFLGDDVALHGGVVVENGCSIGARSMLYPGVCVGRSAQIGEDCVIYPRVVISQNAVVGDKVIIHSGTVIGSQPPPGPESSVDSDGIAHGTVIIEDDVEIGANVTIDSSYSGATIIGRGTKIDNLVHIGNDAAVGHNCIIVSQASVGSHCKLGVGVTIAGQAGVLDGTTIGDGAIIAAKAGVIENVGANQIISGFPADSHEKWLRIYASLKRLPAMVRDIRDFKKRLGGMEESENAESEDD